MQSLQWRRSIEGYLRRHWREEGLLNVEIEQCFSKEYEKVLCVIINGKLVIIVLQELMAKKYFFCTHWILKECGRQKLLYYSFINFVMIIIYFSMSSGLDKYDVNI